MARREESARLDRRVSVKGRCASALDALPDQPVSRSRRDPDEAERLPGAEIGDFTSLDAVELGEGSRIS